MHIFYKLAILLPRKDLLKNFCAQKNDKISSILFMVEKNVEIINYSST